MEKLNITEVESLKNLIVYHDVFYQKLINYSSNCVDPQIKQIFIKEAQNSLNIKQELLSFLN